MINLYIFNELSRGAIYGIGTYIRELTFALKDSNINVCVVHLRSEKQNEKPIESDLVHHYYIPSPINWNTSIDWNKQNDLYYRNVVYLLKLRVKDSERLVFHLNFNLSSQLAEELKRAFDCKIVTTIHYFDWSFLLFGNILHFRQILSSPNIEHDDVLNKSIIKLFSIEKKIFKTVDRIICLSENTENILQDDYQIKPEKITVIYNGLTNTHADSDRALLIQKYYFSDIPIILFVGRLDDIKGLKYAIRAFKTVLKSYQNCQFIIAGEGLFAIHMKECEDIWSHITWTGLISQEKLFNLYSIADIGLMPSFHEQCSFVAIEMMMHGVPLIASTSTGLKEMVEDGITGFHIPVIEYPNKMEIDSSLLAEKILYLLQHPEERKYMKNNARKRYERVYSFDVFRENMLGFYNSLF